MSRYFLLMQMAIAALVLAMPNKAILSDTPAPSDPRLEQVRAAASMIPGQLPTAIHFVRFAEIDTTASFALEGGGDRRIRVVATVFQIRYPNASLLVDAGVDAELSGNFTFLPERHAEIQEALERASMIVITHEHHDHVGGVVRGPLLPVLRSKTLLTRPQVETLMHSPNVPQIRLDPSDVENYLIIDYDTLVPIAPGVVLIKAPGHTPGSQMIFVRLDSGSELLLIGDIAWSMAGVVERRQKPESVSHNLGEDREAIQDQLAWLNAMMTEHGIVVVNSHDDEWLRDLTDRGFLVEGLDLTVP